MGTQASNLFILPCKQPAFQTEWNYTWTKQNKKPTSKQANKHKQQETNKQIKPKHPMKTKNKTHEKQKKDTREGSYSLPLESTESLQYSKEMHISLTQSTMHLQQTGELESNNN